MRSILGLFLLICLLAVVSRAETAKEAHDRSVECMKKCARQPSVIRCEMGCKKAQAGENVVAPHSKNSRAASIREKRKIRHESKKVHPSPDHKKVPAKATTIKGRRVYLVRKN